MIVSRIKVLADLKIDETRIPQDGRIRMSVEGQGCEFARLHPTGA